MLTGHIRQRRFWLPKVVIKYLATLIRPSSKCSVSCITAICHLWAPSKKAYCEQIMTELLPLNIITWPPDAHVSNDEDPLSILLRTAATPPAAFGAAKWSSFWTSERISLPGTESQIMHFHKFTHPVLVATFDALWFYNEVPSVPACEESSWINILLHMVRLKMLPRKKPIVECCDFNLEFFDNPAIAALVSYKWNTIGYTPWLLRFLIHCCYHVLVVTVAVLQVYYSGARDLTGVFITIIVMNSIFLWLELLQAIQTWSRYKVSHYNILDLLALCFPLMASTDQMVVVRRGSGNGNTRLLSFSVLIVFLHMLFELRIVQVRNHYTAGVVEIKVFFVIFATGIFAFTIALLHLLYACPMDGSPMMMQDFRGIS
ncbi:hypothetical protein BGX28_006263 [Mortierella sp. GBA30]|nr:hypothetical protein BGX28_006263 [Mortierella sp. GBA30]